MHIEVSGTGEGVTSGVRKERIVHPGLLAAPDLLRDASERECLRTEGKPLLLPALLRGETHIS